MRTLNSKIREIIDHYELSDRQFAIRIGASPSSIGSMFKKCSEPSSKMICGIMRAFPEISADWFIRDEGNMLRQNSEEAKRCGLLLDTISTLQDKINSQSSEIDFLKQQIALHNK